MPGMTRVLIVTADIGAGHDLPAQLLADALRERGAEVSVVDGLASMGRIFRALVRSGQETVLRRLPWVFEVQYWLVSRFGPTRAVLRAIGTRLGSPGLLRLVERERPDAIVSTYPGTTELFGQLRLSGRLRVPCASAITDLAALTFWANPGIDLHLIIHEESREEVEAIIGRPDGIVNARGMVRPQYEQPPPRAQARAALGLAVEEPVVLVSGGGWGVGDVEAALRAVLSTTDATAVCLCGTNDGLRRRIDQRHANDPRVRTLGFTERMVEWMAAADVLVHSTAGLTILEAQLCGTHAISYGWGVGHIRINNAAYRRFGLAHVAADGAELAALLPRLLAHPREIDIDYAALQPSADAVLELSRPPVPLR
jgi:UDP-N-acetylglucosamine:LPS N-acetylglucosamine transferase